MSTRTIEQVVSPTQPHFVGDGFLVHNFIPSRYGMDMQRMDPFIMMDYNAPTEVPPSEIPRGVGVHPHRGFETVTIAYKGKVAHHDSSGGGGIIGEGDVQWMTAASGVLHKEYHEAEWSKAGGVFQMVQLWVNLPAKDKMSQPKYQAISNKQMGRWVLENGLGEVEVIAGEYKGVHGPAATFTPVHMMNARLNKGGQIDVEFPAHYTTCIVVVEGSITLNTQHNIATNHFVLMARDGESFTIEATEKAVVLVQSGEPLREPIAAQGPFVMNTKQELWQAFADFQDGKFGWLEE
jgi:redox-sensitive bicupin YhaK (pirin superfamily)